MIKFLAFVAKVVFLGAALLAVVIAMGAVEQAAAASPACMAAILGAAFVGACWAVAELMA